MYRRLIDSLSKLIEILKNIGMESTAQRLEKSIDNFREIEKVTIFSGKYIDMFNEFYGMISHINEKIQNQKESKEVIKSEIENFITNIDRVVNNIRSNYIRTKFIVILLTTLYVITSISITALTVATENTLISVNIILWLNIAIVTLLLFDIQSSLFFITALPLVSMIMVLINIGLEVDKMRYVLMLHIIASIIALLFLSQNIDNYKKLMLTAFNLEKKLHHLAEVIHELFSKKQVEASVDLEKYLNIYGDKAYELIKYISDMQKLS
ncbi:MAG: hypothetical protein QXW05_00220 [Ignisphaera sp.]